MAMGVVDTLMLGHVNKEALGSAALANTWLVGCQLIFQGFLFGLDPVVSQAYGARDKRKLSLTLQRGLLLGVLAALAGYHACRKGMRPTRMAPGESSGRGQREDRTRIGRAAAVGCALRVHRHAKNAALL